MCLRNVVLTLGALVIFVSVNTSLTLPVTVRRGNSEKLNAVATPQNSAFWNASHAEV